MSTFAMPCWYLTKPPGPTQPGHPSVPVMVTATGRVLHKSRPYITRTVGIFHLVWATWVACRLNWV